MKENERLNFLELVQLIIHNEEYAKRIGFTNKSIIEPLSLASQKTNKKRRVANNE
ncbi:MAG: hypothetical protein K6F69_06070 [Treponema sp.]|nr:hypothetical protein [Treponema sp.]